MGRRVANGLTVAKVAVALVLLAIRAAAALGAGRFIASLLFEVGN